MTLTPPRSTSLRAALPAVLAVAIACAGPPLAAAGPRARTAAARCADPNPSTRDADNPLLLPRAPGAANPLLGAKFFVQGPRHGYAAGAIAELLGIPVTHYSDRISWARFDRSIHRGRLGRRLLRDPRLGRRVALLEKIAAQPETVRFSSYSAGGGPGAIFSQARKFLCGTLQAAPRTVPLISTYFLYHSGYCPSEARILADRPLVTRWSRELAAAIGRRPAVLLTELDAIGSSACMTGSRIRAWLTNLRIELQALTALPHTVVYVEGGYSDALAPGPTAARLRAAGVGMTQGFFTNDTHFAWTASEIRWGRRVSRLLGGKHFVVNTADNGHGPLLNPHPRSQGIENLCNPPGRGLGPRPTTTTGVPGVDAFIWTGTPGRSAGHCGEAATAPGLFDLHWAEYLATRANGRIGPHSPSRPY